MASRARWLAAWVIAPALGLAAGPATAEAPADTIPAPARPPFERPAGAVLFEDRFATLEAWQPDREGVWNATDSTLCARLPEEKQRRSFLYTGSEDWRRYAVDLDLLQRRGVDKGVVLCVHGGRGIAVDLRGGTYQDVLVYRQSMALGRAPAPNPDGVWHHLRVEARGRRYTVFVDGRQVLDCHDPVESDRPGRIALVAYTGGEAECSVQYANVIVTKLE